MTQFAESQPEFSSDEKVILEALQMLHVRTTGVEFADKWRRSVIALCRTAARQLS